MKHGTGICGAVVAVLAAAMIGGCSEHEALPKLSSALEPPLTPSTPAPAPAAPPPAAVTAGIKLTVVHADSEETAGEDGKAANAVDGDTNSFWHTQWQDAAPEPPHEITIELTPPATIRGFTYLPRQDDSENGMIRDYEFYVSRDGTNFTQVTRGTFPNTKDVKTVTFAPVPCRFIRLRALSEVNDGPWTSAAEIGVLPAP
ncbi:MAG TPA: discoidin domain-containing protein [Verrucomicrobiae bacterium]|nr:discoidin domain-containing protein [Verrucomicrobiae bacterium]